MPERSDRPRLADLGLTLAVTGTGVTRLNSSEPPRRILISKLDGLGDLVLVTPLLAGVHDRWPTADITLVVRPRFASVGELLPDWVRVEPLPFEPRDPVAGAEGHLANALAEVAQRLSADLGIIGEWNRVWASEILADLAAGGRVIAYEGPTGLTSAHDPIIATIGQPLHCSRWQLVEADEHIGEVRKHAAMLAALGITDVPAPAVHLRDADRRAAAEFWRSTGLDPADTVVVFPGTGDGLLRSVTPAMWQSIAVHLTRRHERRLLLFGAESDRDDLTTLRLPEDDDHKLAILPDGAFGLLAGVLASAAAYMGSDTGPMHIAAALGRPTLGIFGGGHDRRFLPQGARAAAVRMPLGCYGCQWLCPFDTRQCLTRMPTDGILGAIDEMLALAPHAWDQPHLVELSPPADMDQHLAGAAMRSHRRWLEINHRQLELAGVQAKRERVEELLAEMVRANEQRDEALAELNKLMAEMSAANADRDRAIEHVNRVLTEMSAANTTRDQAVSHLADTISEISRQNALRDTAIQHVNDVLAEMTKQDQRRDQAINEMAARWGELAGLPRDLEDLRRRSFRIPQRMLRLLGRTNHVGD